ncbi:MAG: adenosine deaminase, partial [Verrucomicrobiota bacterium]
MYTPSKELKSFVQNLPKTETHLHLEGACPFELVQKADPARFKEDPPMWADDFRYESFDQFMMMYDEFCGAVFASAQAYYDCAKKVLQDCADQNVRYVETSFHIGALYSGGMTGPEVIRA